jgi:simple sugar transport system permease protein
LFSGHVLTGFFNAMARWGWIAARDGGGALAIGIPKVIVWWLVLTAIGGFVLARTRRGNWILAAGGDVFLRRRTRACRSRAVKISLFIVTALCAALFAVLQVADAGSAAADRGLQKRIRGTIIAAVIGAAC